MPCSENVVSEDIADFISSYHVAPLEFLNSAPTDCVDFINRQYAVIYTPLEPVLPISLSSYTYSAIPKLYSLLDSTSMEASGILTTARSPVLGNQGRGVLIGIIDTGIDYQNPLFLNSDGTSRIMGIWDQTIQTENSFAGSAFAPLYGTNYTKEQIDEALRSDDPLAVVPSTDTNGHGTFLASIAAGNQSERADFTGAAPLSSLAIVKLKPAKQYLRDFFLIREDAVAFQENDIMMGITYLISIAYDRSMPIIICLGLGTNQGSHSGQSPLGLYLNSISNYTGIAVVTAAGNETGFAHHFRGMVTAGEEALDVELRVGENERGFSMEFWAQDAELYNVGFVSPTGEVIARLPSDISGERRVTFLLEQTVITVFYRITDSISGSQLIFIKFEDPIPGIWHIVVYSSLYFQGIFNMWLPCRGFISDSTYFLRPDPDTTITDPGNTQFPITATAYDHTTGSLYIHASRGFTRTGIPKPDLAAPGVSVQGAGLPAAGQSYSPLPMTRMTGTSVAAAHMAGAAAVLMSWGIVESNEPYMTSSVIKSYLIRGASRNPALMYPNREFGYGTLDLYQAFLSIRN